MERSRSETDRGAIVTEKGERQRIESKDKRVSETKAHE